MADDVASQEVLDVLAQLPSLFLAKRTASELMAVTIASTFIIGGQMAKEDAWRWAESLGGIARATNAAQAHDFAQAFRELIETARKTAPPSPVYGTKDSVPT